VSNPNDYQGQEAAALPLSLLRLKSVTVLTDAAMHAFNVLYDEERRRRRASKARLKAEFDRLDLFGLTANDVSAAAEEYRAGDAGA
jgi:hypothetical protein